MFKPGNPFQDSVDFITDNVFSNSFIGGLLEDNKNLISENPENIIIEMNNNNRTFNITTENNIDIITVDINKYYNFMYKLGNKKLFLIEYDIDLYTLLSLINFEKKVKLITNDNNFIISFDNGYLKTSIIFSIFIKILQDDIKLNNEYHKEIFNIVLLENYKKIVNNLEHYTNYVTNFYDVDTVKTCLDILYFYLFENENNLEFILNSDRKLLLRLLTSCYMFTSHYYFNLIMNKLNFNDEFVTCLHNIANNIKFENAEFKEYFKLE